MKRMFKKADKFKSSKDAYAAAVKEVFAKGIDQRQQPESIDVDITEQHDGSFHVKVHVAREYSACPLTGKVILGLINVFGTDNYVVDNFSHTGCETCDYGSSYGHDFSFVTKNLLGVEPKAVLRGSDL